MLSNGKKVVPSYLEGLLLADPCIDQAVVYGEGRNFLTALIVPHWDNVAPAAAAAYCQRKRGSTSQPPCRAQVARRKIHAALKDVASWEHVKAFAILPGPFSVAAEELTVSLKLRRNVIFEHYRKELEALHAGGTGGGMEE